MKRIVILEPNKNLLSTKNAAYQPFFSLLRAFGAELIPRKNLNHARDLDGIDGVILSTPVRRFPSETLQNLREMVYEGMSLWVTSEVGGEENSHGVEEKELFPDFLFLPHTLHKPNYEDDANNLVFSIPWQTRKERESASLPSLSSLPEELKFVSGCNLRIPSHWEILDAWMLPPESNVQVHEGEVEDDWNQLLAYNTDKPIRPVDRSHPLAVVANVGAGRVIAIGSTLSLHREFLKPLPIQHHTTWNPQLRWLVEWIDYFLRPSTHDELKRRMQRPQRHRLLQGYPMLPLLETTSPASERSLLPPPEPPFVADTSSAKIPASERSHLFSTEPSTPRQAQHPTPWEKATKKVTLHPSPTRPQTLEGPGSHRSILVGVLPHPFCNPRVQGCGFCTFPQEKMNRHQIPILVDRTCDDIRRWQSHTMDAKERHVRALYFGGATANLTPPRDFTKLLDTLEEAFTFGEAEITLEGVPKYFQIQNYQLLRSLRSHFPSNPLRISMGIQTLDPRRLKEMGREGFGTRQTFREVVAFANAQDIATSCDMLINLPGQSVEEMLLDLKGVIALGYDQICLYHLVLYKGLGTPWSHDNAQLQRLPDNEQAFANWRRCRDFLLEQGFVQSTLTNFERITSSRPHFVYEPCGFQPEKYDLLGFGPNSITSWLAADARSGWKTVAPRLAYDFLTAPHHSTAPYPHHERRFHYKERDTKILYITRAIARMKLSKIEYRDIFGSHMFEDFAEEWAALLQNGLVSETPDAFHITERGLFFADTIAGLIAWKRVPSLRYPLEMKELPARNTNTTGPLPLHFADPNEAIALSMG